MLEIAGMEYHEAVNKTAILMTTLQNLNFALEKANTINKPVLITLETTIAKLGFYKKILKNCRKVKPIIYENDSNGIARRIKQEPLMEKAELESIIRGLQKQKNELEETLMKVNASTPVEFDWEAAENLL